MARSFRVSGTLIKVLVPSLFPSLELSACLPAASSGSPLWYAAECIPRRQLATRHERPLKRAFLLRNLERETGFEPATSTLARSHSTTELLPLSPFILLHFSGSKQICYTRDVEPQCSHARPSCAMYRSCAFRASAWM